MLSAVFNSSFVAVIEALVGVFGSSSDGVGVESSTDGVDEMLKTVCLFMIDVFNKNAKIDSIRFISAADFPFG